MKYLKSNKKILLILIFIFFINIKFNIFAINLKKGIYEIKNHYNNTTIFIDESSNILLEGNNFNKVGSIKDIFTGEILYIYKKYETAGNLEVKEEKIYYGDPDSEDYYIDYKEGIKNKIKFDDIYIDKNLKNVSNIFNNKEVIATFDEIIIFNDATYYDRNLNQYKEINEIKNDFSNENKIFNNLYSENTFKNYIFFSARDDSYGTVYTYFFDKNMNLIKKITNYEFRNFYHDKNNNLYLLFNKIYSDNKNPLAQKIFINEKFDILDIDDYEKDNKNTIYFNNGIFYNVGKNINKNDNINNKLFKNINNNFDKYISEKINLKTDNINLTTTLNNGVIINDFVCENSLLIDIDDKKFYFFYYLNIGYIYDENGIRRKIIDGLDFKSFKKVGNFIVGLYDKDQYIYDINFKFIKKCYNVKSLFGGKYYYLGYNNSKKKGSIDYQGFIYDEKIENELTGFGGTYVKEFDNKYLVIANGLNGKITVYDDDFKIINQFDGNKFDYEPYIISNNIYYMMWNNKNGFLVSSDFKKIFFKNINLVHQKSVNFDGEKVDLENKIFIRTISNKYIVLDENLNEICSFDDYVSEFNNKYIIVFNDEKLYDLYDMNKNKILSNFKYIGDLEDEYFTFQNGFYYGLMDYNMNVICKYSIFNNFDNENYDYYDY